MNIVLTGGGSGGHITPLLAVAAELKRLNPEARLIYVGQAGDKLANIAAEHPAIDKAHAILAGKYRRYHSLGWRRFLKFGTLLLNIRDVFYVGIGYLQSLGLLIKYKPAVIFVKGGFVGVPVGLAAALLRVPFVTHDSDSMPGLANRIIARWAAVHAVGQPAELYNYPAAKTVVVGVPVQPEFTQVTSDDVATYRQALGLPATGPVITVAGGGLGAQSINQALLKIVHDLFMSIPEVSIIHQVGQRNEAAMDQAYDAALAPDRRRRVLVKGYVTDMYRLSGAADLIVTRAGATNMAEFAIQAKPCLIIPSPYLAGGHQLKNAEALAERHAVENVSEFSIDRDPQVLRDAIVDLMNRPDRRATLAANLRGLAYPDAAHRLAVVLLEQVKNTKTPHEKTNRQTEPTD